ncbi:hypothetical protein [Porphyromonas somerae]|uniref:hypothetical protein n=1 Tax=Porphyromonas somerae TaxID=322095 RepID=UPI000364D322|nr:hypothetical protein [Porphyromonas somerae]
MKPMSPLLLPTPTASDSKGGGQKVAGLKKTRPSGVTYSSNLRDLLASQLLPTSTVQEGEATFPLNPLYVEEMMGFPESWTLLPFLDGEQRV